MVKNLVRIWFILGILPVFLLVACKREPGSIYLMVKTKEGDAKGAEVSVMPIGKTYLVEDSGEVTIRNLPPGTYDLSISHDDFQPSKKTIIVSPGKLTRVEAFLGRKPVSSPSLPLQAEISPADLVTPNPTVSETPGPVAVQTPPPTPTPPKATPQIQRISSGDFVAVESFDYPADAKVDGLSGGTGWAGPWEKSWSEGWRDGRDLGEAVITFPGLSYASQPNASAGGKVSSEAVHLRRLLATSFSGAFWMSYIGQRTEGDGEFVVFPMEGKKETLFVGANRGSGVWTIQTAKDLKPMKADEPALVVYYYDGNGNHRMWIDPPGPDAILESRPNAILEGREIRNINGLLIKADRGTRFIIDEIRFGLSPQSVIPK